MLNGWDLDSRGQLASMSFPNTALTLESLESNF